MAPEPILRHLFEAFRLEVCYDRRLNTATCRVTVAAESIAGLRQAAERVLQHPPDGAGRGRRWRGGPGAEVLSMDRRTEVVEASLPNGVTIGVEVVEGEGADNVSARDQLDFRQVEGVIESLAQVVTSALHGARPNRATAPPSAARTRRAWSTSSPTSLSSARLTASASSP
ncbi:MAG TPA: hypothetical protein VKI99_06575 [Candidatus Dormibacteraeota bacterium]|nr:hypothetical protein [Candidatus Dormibacteraeota bacterium]